MVDFFAKAVFLATPNPEWVLEFPCKLTICMGVDFNKIMHLAVLYRGTSVIRNDLLP